MSTRVGDEKMDNDNENLKLMESASIPKAILTLAIPTVLSMIVSLIYNITDTYFIGLLDDPIQLGAISLAFPVFMIFQALGNMFGSGAPSYISRCLGAKKYEEVKKTSAVSVYVSATAMLVLTILGLIFMEPILHLIGTSSETIIPTRDYLSIIITFSIVIMLQIILPAMLRAEGKVKQAVAGMIIGTVLNIVLDPIFILVFGMGAAGAAWATIIGNAVAVVFYIYIYLRGNTIVSILPRDFKPSARIFKEVLKIGFPASLSQILGSTVMVLFNNLAAEYGDTVISAYGVAIKMIQMEFMILFGYVSGYMPFAGYNYGAGNITRLVKALKFTIMTASVLCLLFLIPFTILAPAYIKIFSSNEEIINIGVKFLTAQAWAVPFMGIQLSLMATFQATGQAFRALLVNMGRQFLFYVPYLYLFNYIWGLEGLLKVQMAADLSTTTLSVIIALHMIKGFYKKEKEELAKAT